MSSLNQTFIADELPQPTSDFSPLPDGFYNVVVTKAEVKNTKDGTGQYIAVRYDVTGPTHQGRVVFGNLNIKNKSSVAEDIGRQQLGSLMRSIGLDRVDDTDQLIGGNLSIKLATRTQEGYEPTNEIKAFKAIEGALPSFANSVKQLEQTPAKSSAPWAKK